MVGVEVFEGFFAGAVLAHYLVGAGALDNLGEALADERVVFHDEEALTGRFHAELADEGGMHRGRDFDARAARARVQPEAEMVLVAAVAHVLQAVVGLASFRLGPLRPLSCST